MAGSRIKAELPSELQQEYDALLESLAQNEEDSKQPCLLFMQKLLDGVQPPTIAHYFALEIREQFTSNAGAMEYLQDMLQMLKEKESSNAHIELLIDTHALIADVYKKENKILEAEEYYEEALRLLPKANPNCMARPIIYARLAHFSYQKNEGSEESREYYDKAMGLLDEYLLDTTCLDDENVMDRVQALVALATLSDLRRLQKKYETMESILTKALPLAAKQSKIEESRVLSWLVLATQQQGKEEEMLKYALKATDLVKKIKDNPSLMKGTTLRRLLRHHDRIAYTLFSSKIHERAITYYKNTLALAKQFFGDSHPYIAQASSTIAKSLFDAKLDNGDEYKQMAEKVLQDIEQELEDGKFLAANANELHNTYSNLGLLCQKQKQYAEAESYLERALQLSKTVQADAPMRLAKWHKHLGLLYLAWEKKQQAVEHLQTALQLHENQPEQQRDQTTIWVLKNALQQASSSSPRYQRGRGRRFPHASRRSDSSLLARSYPHRI